MALPRFLGSRDCPIGVGVALFMQAPGDVRYSVVCSWHHCYYADKIYCLLGPILVSLRVGRWSWLHDVEV